ncbi:MAG: hypothetical protein WBZ36_03775 [Candidatus Nitrosopolaris sp.]
MMGTTTCAVEMGFEMMRTCFHLEKDVIQEELRQSVRQIRVQYITKPLQTKIVVVVDQANSVAIEISDDAKETLDTV